MKKLFFLSSILPHQNYEWIKQNSKGPMSNANDSFQRALITGFIQNGVEVELLNIPNIGAFPLNFNKIYSPEFFLNEEGGLKGYNFGFLNVNLIKHRFIYNALEKFVKRKYEEIDYLIIYDLYLPFLEIAKLIKSKNKNTKIVLVIPDIYGFTGYSKNFFHKLLTNSEEEKIYKNLQWIDGFVLLTDKMKDKIPNFNHEKKSIVVEGILNPDILDVKEQEEQGSKKIILYSGAIEERHGIINLIEAFKKNDIDAELHFYGDGSAKDKVIEAALTIPQIKFFGQKTREEIIKKQKSAFLLVNPRTSDGEFTKYSFPSKVIEYFASGTPTLMYKLEGIPDKYYKYCFIPEDESVEELANSLHRILLLNEYEMEKKGKEAKKFIVQNKNCQFQTQKIIKLIKKI